MEVAPLQELMGTIMRSEKYWFSEELQVEKCRTERNLEGRTFQVL